MNYAMNNACFLGNSGCKNPLDLWSFGRKSFSFFFEIHCKFTVLPGTYGRGYVFVQNLFVFLNFESFDRLKDKFSKLIMNFGAVDLKKPDGLRSPFFCKLLCFITIFCFKERLRCLRIVAFLH